MNVKLKFGTYNRMATLPDDCGPPLKGDIISVMNPETGREHTVEIQSRAWDLKNSYSTLVLECAEVQEANA